MSLVIRKFNDNDLDAMREIWNEVVRDAVAFPQIDELTKDNTKEFFAGQSFSAVAEYDGEVVGLYILHPNNIGRCGHLSNASYAVKSTMRGKKIGEELVKHCLAKGRELGFKVLQFNAVVATNHSAIKLYDKLGFVRLGKVPSGFLMKDGSYEDIILFYHVL